MTEPLPSCWVVTEGIAGTENQCLGVAEAMGIAPVVKRIRLRFPWKQLSPWLGIGHGLSLAAGSDPIAPPWPDLVLASGRKAVGIGLHVKQKSGGRSFLVNIQDPRLAPARFDLVVVPQHDKIRGENVMVTTAGLHRVTPKRLAEARAAWQERLAALPAPRVAVLIGGNSRAHEMTPENAKSLAAQLQRLAGEGAGLMVTASRRTGPENARILRDALAGSGNAFFWDESGDNPYFAFLALTDYIIVTEDSVSMTSEAISTGKPVLVAGLSGGAARLDAFHRLLQAQGYTRPFTGALEAWSYDPPNDTIKVAERIRAEMKGRM